MKPEEDNVPLNYGITNYGADYTLEILSNMLDRGEIKIPHFQRGYVWDKRRASALIESFLLGLPVPQIFLYRAKKSQDLLVIDGQQRLKSINYFLNGKWKNQVFKLKGVDKLKGTDETWENKAFEDLSVRDKRRLKNTILRSSIFEQNSPEDDGDSSIFKVFHRLNSGGMNLNQQEIRNCIYHGEIVSFLKELNEIPEWRKILNGIPPDKRYRDIELILRMLSLCEKWEHYKPPMKNFMNDWMKENQNISADKQEQLKNTFSSIINSVLSCTEPEKAFRIDNKGKVNIQVTDSIFVALSKSDDMANSMLNYSVLLKDKDYIDIIKGQPTTSEQNVMGRIRKAMEVLK